MTVLNQEIFERLAGCAKEASDAVNDFTRAKMREQSFLSAITSGLKEVLAEWNALAPEEQQRIREKQEQEYAAARAEYRHDMQHLFELGKVRDMAETFCHEGFGLHDYFWNSDVPEDKRWFEVGTCSHGERVTWSEWKASCGWHMDTPWELLERSEEQWPACVKEAMRRLGEWMLKQLDDGADGC